jgi:omega-6 fatty acid desaturase (delta-12 desaturase)
MFAPHQYGQIILSDIGVLLWLGALAAWIYQSGFSQVFRLYLVPYLWCIILVILKFHIS